MPRSSTSSLRRRAGYLGLVAMVAAAVLLVRAAAGAPTIRSVPATRDGFPDWMAGPFASLGGALPDSTFLGVFLAMSVAYLVVLACADALPVRVALGIVVVLHLLFWLAPPLFSRDIFNYIEYGRMFGLHGLDPYTHGAGFLVGDPATQFVCCRGSPDPYGPGFTLLSAALSHVGLPGAFWALKSISALSSLGVVALVWRIARMLGRAPLPAALFVGLNPVALAFEVGGGHNDALMMLVVLGAIAVFLAGEEARGVALAVASVAVKVTGVIVAPFMLVAAREWRRAILGALVVAALLFLMLVGVFGSGAFAGGHRALSLQQHDFYLRSVPQALGQLLSLGSAPHALKTVLMAGFVALVAWQLWRVWRGASWIAAAGWATLGLLVSSSWLLPWYVTWLLPLAALSPSRRLRVAALVATAYVIWARAPLLA